MKTWLKVMLVLLAILIIILIYDYFSGSFNIVFFPEKSLGVAIYGTPLVENKIKLG